MLKLIVRLSLVLILTTDAGQALAAGESYEREPRFVTWSKKLFDNHPKVYKAYRVVSWPVRAGYNTFCWAGEYFAPAYPACQLAGAAAGAAAAGRIMVTGVNGTK